MMTLEEAVDTIAEDLSDSFQMSDLWSSIPAAMNIVESFHGLSGQEKKERVIKIGHFDVLQ